ncbi:unnamed protein product, partial [Amoebophrya sp. A120]|eukprot:GSA120T00006681001.1
MWGNVEFQVDPKGFQERKARVQREYLSQIQVRTKVDTQARGRADEGVNVLEPISREKQNRQTIMRASGEITNAHSAQCLLIRGTKDYAAIADNPYLLNNPTLAKKREEFLAGGGRSSSSNSNAKRNWTGAKSKLFSLSKSRIMGGDAKQKAEERRRKYLDNPDSSDAEEPPNAACLAMIRCIEKVRTQIKGLKIRDELIDNLLTFVTSDFMGERTRGNARANEWWTELGVAEHVEPTERTGKCDRVLGKLKAHEKSKVNVSKVETVFPGVGYVKRPTE